MNSSTSSSKRLIALFAGACASVFAIAVAASEWLVREKVMPEDTLHKHVQLFEDTHAPYAAFGDSHAARGFHAVAPVVNLAYPSENIEKMAWKADRYLARVASPKAVLIQADPHLFAQYREEAGLGDYPETFSEQNTAVMVSLSARYRPQLIALWQAFITSGGQMRSSIELTSQGALLSPGDLSDWSDARIAQFTTYRAKLHAPAVDFQSTENAQRYRAMVKRFADAGAQVCLVSFPVSPIYREQASTNHEEAIAFFKSLATASSVKFIDDRARYDDPALFRDPDHLNKKGALLYGPRLHEACFQNVEEASLVASAG